MIKSLRCRCPRFVVAAALLAASLLQAALAADAVAPPQGAASCPSAKSVADVSVSRVYLSSEADTPEMVAKLPREPEVRLRQSISLKVDNLQTLLDKEQCSAQGKKMVLFLDGRPLPDLQPNPRTDPSRQTLNFQLERNESSRAVWTHLLGKPTFTARAVPVSVGMEDEYAVSSREKIRLEVIPLGWFALWSLVFLALFAFFWALAVQSDVLRDAGPDPAGGARKPYSLSRMQAAVWFFLILASYLFIGMITGDYSTTITSTVLGLMGISAGTAVGSAVIDSAPATPAAGAVPVPVAAPPIAATRGVWWLDILSEGGGVSFHRFQMAAWTGILGIIFVQQVYKSLAMPDFDNTLLGLLGLSAGTFLGMKATTETK